MTKVKRAVLLVILLILFLLISCQRGAPSAGLSKSLERNVENYNREGRTEVVATTIVTPTAQVFQEQNFVVLDDSVGLVSHELLNLPELQRVRLSDIVAEGGFANVEDVSQIFSQMPEFANVDNAGRPPQDVYIFQYPGSASLLSQLSSILDTSLHTNDPVLCGYDMADWVNATRAAAKAGGIPMSIMGPLFLSESWFTNTLPAPDGGCYLLNNSVAACMGQIYKPAGWSFVGREIHPEVNVNDLYDPFRCAQESVRILDGRQYWTPLSGTGERSNPYNWFDLVAGYKNITRSHEHFTGTFEKYFNAGGFAYTYPENGKTYWISFSDSLVDSQLVFE